MYEQHGVQVNAIAEQDLLITRRLRAGIPGSLFILVSCRALTDGLRQRKIKPRPQLEVELIHAVLGIDRHSLLIGRQNLKK